MRAREPLFSPSVATGSSCQRALSGQVPIGQQHMRAAQTVGFDELAVYYYCVVNGLSKEQYPQHFFNEGVRSNTKLAFYHFLGKVNKFKQAYEEEAWTRTICSISTPLSRIKNIALLPVVQVFM